jgi:magnesium chelatase subunit I
VLTVFKDHFTIEDLRDLIDAFDDQTVVSAGDDVRSADYVRLLDTMPPLRPPVIRLTGGDESPAAVASAAEFVLEGLHLSKRLNKESVGARAQYRGR